MADDNDDQQIEATPAPVTSEPAKAVTDRPADVPSPNTTLADRAKARSADKPASKAVDDDDTENKAVTTSATKRPRRKT